MVYSDFNLPKQVSNKVDSVDSMDYTVSSPSSIVVELFIYNGLSQINMVTNDRSVFLDLCFTHICSLKGFRACDALLPKEL